MNWIVPLVVIANVATTPISRPCFEEASWFHRASLPPRLRTMREFAEQEIVLTSGKYRGNRFRTEVQPFSGLWLDAHDSGRWNRFAVTGPSQSGKTLNCFSIPILYHLFERRETVVAAVPHMEMISDKWHDLLPVIEATRYRDYIPTSGRGSRGGMTQSMRFRNGATLRWMTGGGSDKTVAGFTTRVLVVTETDGMDTASETSREADRITQLEARARSYGIDRRIYLECTVSIEQGRIWQEYTNGTASRIMLPCPHCREYVQPEREHYHGWQEATNEVEARRLAFFYCPACGERWTEDERVEANRGGVLVHRGQEIDRAGVIHGDPPETNTLGFRWSAVNNLLLSNGEFAEDEWKASRAQDEENAEKEMRQFVWCIPYEPPEWDDTPLDPHKVALRSDAWPQLVLPPDTVRFVAALDVHKWHIEFLTVAFRQGGQIHVPDYGVLDVHSDDMAEDRAILAALREFREAVDKGWAVEGSQKRRLPDRVFIDAGYQADTIFRFIGESGTGQANRYLAAIGRGLSQMQRTRYNAPKKTGNEVRRIGEGWHLSRVPSRRSWQITVDADHWKRKLQQALAIDVGLPGSISLYDVGLKSEARKRHNKISRHFTSEKLVVEEKPGRGRVERWEKHGENHWLDCGYNCLAAGSFLEVAEAAVKQQQAATEEGWWKRGKKRGERVRG